MIKKKSSLRDLEVHVEDSDIIESRNYMIFVLNVLFGMSNRVEAKQFLDSTRILIKVTIIINWKQC